MVVAAVAAGAVVAASAGQLVPGGSSDADVTPLANAHDAKTEHGVGGAAPAAPAILPAQSRSDASAEVQKLTESQEVTEARLQREAEEEEARKQAEADAAAGTAPNSSGIAKPLEGRLTSTFGARWGTQHTGIDIAAPLGTPIHAVADGTVLEAGPASGFGLWVRIQHTDGTVSVYGHMNSISVSAGQQVAAGEQIADVGSRGYSTGPHLHLEIWTSDGGAKIDPLSWLAERGVTI